MYSKLFADILESSLWDETSDVRIVWITLLAMSNQDGYVRCTDRALSRRAGVSLDETTVAINKFLGPDPYSRNQAAEGRKMTRVDGGFHLTNFVEYHKLRTAQERREYMRTFMQKKRNPNPVSSPLAPVSNVSPYIDKDVDVHKDLKTSLRDRTVLAREILAVYSKLKPPSLDSSRSRAKNHLLKLLQKHTIHTLLRAVRNYASICTRQEPQYRRNSGNFFGRDADWKDFASKDWKPEADPTDVQQAVATHDAQYLALINKVCQEGEANDQRRNQ